MRKYSSNLSFVDMLFNLLVGFTSLFILAFLLINPIADEGKIDPVTQFLLQLTWQDDLPPDLDIHVRVPDGSVISFRRKDHSWAVLDRDDLGMVSDVYRIDGEVKIVPKNMEVVNFNAIVPGEYVVNVHFYGCTKCDAYVLKTGDADAVENVSYTIQLWDMHPFKVVFSTVKEGLRLRQEQTVMTFVVTEDGKIEDIRTDIRIPLYFEEVGP